MTTLRSQPPRVMFPPQHWFLEANCLACDSDSCARSRWQFVHCRKIWGTLEGSCKLVHLPISQILLCNSLYGCLMLPASDGLTSKCRSWRTCRPSSLGSGASPHQLCTAPTSALLPYTSPRIQAPTSPVCAVTTPDYVVEVYLLTRRPPRCPSPVSPQDLRLGRL